MSFQTGCFGSFGLTVGLWNWNSSLGKWPGELVFLIIGVILPIYGIAAFIDVIILNTIEFWTGSNPMAMGPNDMEKQVVVGKDGNTYEIVATQNRFDIRQLDGSNAGNVQSLVYNAETSTWSYQDATQSIKLASLSNNGATVQVYAPNGQVAIVPSNMTDKAQIQAVVEDQLETNLAIMQ